LVTQAAAIIIARHTDAEKRRRAETALRQSEERLRLAMGAGDMGAWEYEVQTGAVIWDAKQYEIFGLPADHPPATVDAFFALLHPDDVDRIKRATADAALSGRFLEEFRVVRPDGTVRWIAGVGATLPDDIGR